MRCVMMGTVLVVTLGSVQAAPRYTVADLGTLPGGSNSVATGINASGQVVGWANLRAAGAVKWTHGVIADLGTLGGNNSVASGINAGGQVVGWANLPGEVNAKHAVEWTQGVITDLGTLPGGTFSVATGINANGQVVGQAATVGVIGQIAGQPPTVGKVFHAFLWTSSGGITDLNSLIDPGLGWTLMNAVAINDSGQIVGDGFHHNSAGQHYVLSHAFLLTPLTRKNHCKNHGWKTFGFKNQGQCIQFVNTGK
jgi:probable HAF family extracellular repeat protein